MLVLQLYYTRSIVGGTVYACTHKPDEFKIEDCLSDMGDGFLDGYAIGGVVSGAKGLFSLAKSWVKTGETTAKYTEVVSEGGSYSNTTFATEDKLVSHFEKHGNEFKGIYNSADEYLQGARDVMNNGYKVEYSYKGETRVGYVQFMGNNSKGKAKFAFVGTNNEGYITTFHTESGKTFWKLLNGENIPVINPK